MARSLLCGALSAAVVVRALVHPEPRATGFVVMPLDAHSPVPTTPPALHEYFKRQNGNGQTVLVAPDNTCGYVSAQSGAAYTCVQTTAVCVFITASGSGAAGCCGDKDCGFRVACLDFDQISSSSLCDAECSTDTFTEKCTDASARFCGTITFPNGATDYFCNSLRVTTAMSADITYSGQTGRSLIQTVLTDVTPTTRRPITTIVTTTTIANGSNTSAPGGSTPVGAIVGGVVGGIAVLGLIGLGVFFLIRQKKKTKFQPVPLHPPGSDAAQHNFPGGDAAAAGKPGHQSMMSNYSGAPSYGTPTPSPGLGGFYPPGAYGQATSPPHHQQGFPQQGYGQPGMPVVYEAGGEPIQGEPPIEMEAPRRVPRHELQ